MANSKRKLRIFAKIIISVLVLLIIGFVVFASIDVNRKIHYWTLYSENEHLERVTKRVEERYIENKYNHSEYEYITDYTIAPLYDENEELSFFLVEFEPYGFACIKIHKDYSWLSNQFGLFGMYARYEVFPYTSWYRYRISDDEIDVYPNSCWAKRTINRDVYYEVDKDGNEVKYSESYYKVAGIQESERKYLLEVKANSNTIYIPAVRRGDKWLNLVSMEEFDLSQFPMDTSYPSSRIWYPVDLSGNL
ncbi:MAG: hypothetical protein K2J16_04605 [Clostridia bacterium]|nr:hypothetical protein [Clostridia bacterium]